MSATTVRVTETHIDVGEPGDPCTCALALALHDALKAEGADVANVEVTDAYIGEWEAIVEQRDAAGVRRFRAELEQEAAEFVEAFDLGDEVGPAEFEFTWTEIAEQGDDE